MYLLRSLTAFAAFICVAAPAAAYDAQRYRVVLNDCLTWAGNTDRERLETCIGAITLHCIDSEPGGETTAGMRDCSWLERNLWDEHLNARYQRLMRLARQIDQRDRLDPPIAGSLRAAQRAWIDFRDADCALQGAMGMGGTIGTIIAASCHSDMTAHRAIDLILNDADLRR